MLKYLLFVAVVVAVVSSFIVSSPGAVLRNTEVVETSQVSGETDILLMDDGEGDREKSVRELAIEEIVLINICPFD